VADGRQPWSLETGLLQKVRRVLVEDLSNALKPRDADSTLASLDEPEVVGVKVRLVGHFFLRHPRGFARGSYCLAQGKQRWVWGRRHRCSMSFSASDFHNIFVVFCYRPTNMLCPKERPATNANHD
jgi:hypothetical protein